MIAYYDITTTLKDALLEDKNVNTVTKGVRNDIDKYKQTLTPLSHIRVENVIMEAATLRLSVSIELLDIVDITSTEEVDKFIGNDNKDDVFNTQLAVGVRLMDRIRRGDLWGSTYQLDGEPNFEPLDNEYENGFYGWLLTFDVLYNHDMTIC